MSLASCLALLSVHAFGAVRHGFAGRRTLPQDQDVLAGAAPRLQLNAHPQRALERMSEPEVWPRAAPGQPVVALIASLAG